MSNDYVYQGIRSPFEWLADGDIAKMTDRDLIIHSLQILFENKEWTRPGALRVGSAVPDSVFDPNDITEQIAIDTAVRACIARCEPRAECLDVAFETSLDNEDLDDETLRIIVKFRIVVTGKEDIYSHDLKEAAEIT